MTIEEIRNLEENRSADQLNVVHFVKEGNGFYRAHDFSAWLLKTFPPNDVIADMSVSAKRQKNGYVDAFVGFPATSLKKYIPDAEAAGFNVVDDAHFTVTVEPTADYGDATYENYAKLKDDWKNSLPVTENKKPQREEREVHQQAPRIARFTDIISRLVSLPIEDMSPREAYEYLRDLRRQVAGMF